MAAQQPFWHAVIASLAAAVVVTLVDDPGAAVALARVPRGDRRGVRRAGHAA